jgi:hypothetical protein
MMPVKKTAEDVEKEAKALNPKLSIIKETFTTTKNLCSWIEEGYGVFERVPHRVINKKIVHHPIVEKELAKKKNLEKWGHETATQSPAIRAKRNQTNLTKYGNTNPFGSDVIKRQIRDTNMKKYGHICASQALKIKEKIRKTSLEKYGTEYALQSAEVKEKISQTNIDRYGVSSPSRNKSIKEKIRTTCLERYGSGSPLQNAGVKDKIKSTLLERYSVAFVSQCPEIRNKIKKTNLQRYGVEVVTKSPEIQEKIKKTNLRRYGVERPSQNPEIHKKTIRTALENGTLYRSHKEKELFSFCRTLDPDTRTTIVRYNDVNFQIDILMPRFNLCIEFNGLYWHSEANKKHYKNKHLYKTKACNAKGFRLIHIWEHEWDLKPEIIQNYIRSCAGVFGRREYARKCQVRQITDTGIVKTFLQKNHILGSCQFQKAYGLFQSDELLGAITVNIHHRNSKEMVVNRTAFEVGVQVVGGVSKLSQCALQESGATYLVTWADIRLGAGSVYEKSGWDIDQILPPDYFYFNLKTRGIVTKQSRRKSLVNTPTNMTEHEHALNDRLFRIYDCGKIRFKITKV